MLDNLLGRVESTFPANQWRHVDEAHWRGVMASFCRELGSYSRYLLAAASTIVNQQRLAEARKGLSFSLKPFPTVCEYVISPDAAYYKRFNKSIPSPDNPSGPHARGISVELKLMRGDDAGDKVRPIRVPRLVIVFHIWGDRERAAFVALFDDHRRSIDRLLTPLEGIEFFTSCVFENIEQAIKKKKSAFTQLCLYAKNEIDDESSFDLSMSFAGDDSIEAQVVTLTRFLVLYDLAFGYCQSKPQRDRIDNYRALIEQ
jgi:hypothetical protein